MPMMTGGQALAKSLVREGVRVIFGLPGVQLYHLLDGLHHESDIRFITTRHEQSTTYMADGYARAGGGIGTALVVPGPGLQNASAGIGTAYSASSPILVVSGQVERHLIGVDRGALHEVNDQMDTIRPVTKWASRILEAKDVPANVQEAFRQLRTDRPRPVEIEIPARGSGRGSGHRAARSCGSDPAIGQPRAGGESSGDSRQRQESHHPRRRRRHLL